jgi:hypothetical protein
MLVHAKGVVVVQMLEEDKLAREHLWQSHESGCCMHLTREQLGGAQAA